MDKFIYIYYIELYLKNILASRVVCNFQYFFGSEESCFTGVPNYAIANNNQDFCLLLMGEYFQVDMFDYQMQIFRQY